jgi:hypothetical protein
MACGPSTGPSASVNGAPIAALARAKLRVTSAKLLDKGRVDLTAKRFQERYGHFPLLRLSFWLGSQSILAILLLG